MTEDSKTRKRTLAGLHLFSSMSKLKNKGTTRNNSLNDSTHDYHIDQETLLKDNETAMSNHKQYDADKKHNITGSIKKALLLGAVNRHRGKFSRQSTIDIGDIKSAVKAQQQCANSTVQIDKEYTSEDERSSVAHLDLAELSHSHRRTATCEELEKFTLDQSTDKSLYALRKDLLTLQRLKEWSFI